MAQRLAQRVSRIQRARLAVLIPVHPVGFLELEGRPVNPTEQCLEPGLPVSCSRGGSPLLSCWVDSSTDTVYSVDYIGCMANPKWVKCSDMLQSMVASVTADCEH